MAGWGTHLPRSAVLGIYLKGERGEMPHELTAEDIENELESELGWRWTPQMRHGFGMQKLWNKLVEARLALADQAKAAIEAAEPKGE